MSTHYFVGLDLGQKGDYTAIAVVEHEIQALGGTDPVTFEPRTATRLDVRHLERLALGTSYLDVVERVVELVHAPELTKNCTLVVDATGVGAPVVDLLRRAPLECTMLAVMITGGDQQSRRTIHGHRARLCARPAGHAGDLAGQCLTT